MRISLSQGIPPAQTSHIGVPPLGKARGSVTLKHTNENVSVSRDPSSFSQENLVFLAGLFINNSVLAEQLEGERGEAVFTSIEAMVFILCLSLLDCEKATIKIATAACSILIVMWAFVWALGFVRKHRRSVKFNFWMPISYDLRPWLSEAAALSMLILSVVHLYSKITGEDGHKTYRVEKKFSPPIVATMVLTLVVVAVVWIVKLTKYWGAVTHVETEEEEQKAIPMHTLAAVRTPSLPAHFAAAPPVQYPQAAPWRQPGPVPGAYPSQ